jgi:hypothetical protein
MANGDQTAVQKKMAEFLKPFFSDTKKRIEEYLENPTVPHLFHAQKEIVKLNVLLETFTVENTKGIVNQKTKNNLKQIVRNTRRLNKNQIATLKNFNWLNNTKLSLGFTEGTSKYGTRKSRR